MLRTLRIRGLVLFDDVSVELGEGLHVLTGETGAGKSIFVQALGLAGGDRADPSLVRAGEKKAIVEAAFALQGEVGETVRSRLERKGLDRPGDDVVVRREVPASGSGRVLVDGSPTTLAALREAGDLLLELHGQHEHQSLLSAERHLELLDRFGDHDEAVGRVAVAHRSALEAIARVERLRESAGEAAVRSERLRAEIREIDSVAPKPGESADLDRERELLRNAGRVADLLEGAVEALYDGEPSAAGLAASAARRIEDLAAIDPTLGDLARAVDSARVELEEAGATLRDWRERTSFDPGRLEEVEARRVAIERLLLRYGPDEESVQRHRDAAAGELAELEDPDRGIAAAEAAREDALLAYREAADELSRARRKASKRLGTAVSRELRELAMPHARFEVRLEPARGADAGGMPLHPSGAERIEFLLAANAGEEAAPLRKAASGGELSRTMLALHGVLDRAEAGRVLVFDEVDAGVGGAVADAVGRRLAALAKRHEVLCVTHLPQVAAWADRHYHVRKRESGGRTRAEIVELDHANRVKEIARMLGGREITPASRRAASELLSAAAGSEVEGRSR